MPGGKMPSLASPSATLSGVVDFVTVAAVHDDAERLERLLVEQFPEVVHHVGYSFHDAL